MMIERRILPIIFPFVISSLVLTNVARTPYLLKFYQSALEARDDDKRFNSSSVINNVASLFTTTSSATSNSFSRNRANDDSSLNSVTSKAVATRRRHANSTRPPLSSIILDARKHFVKNKDGGRNQTIIGDPQFLLDFAIIGFPKCGTSTLSVLLQDHPETAIHKNEMQHLSYRQPATHIWELYTKLPPGDFVRGYKSPFDVTNQGGAIDFLRGLFPNIKLIVGVRHPISWFESFYNFRLQRNVSIPAPYRLMQINHHGFGVKAANFHVPLAKLGKTSMTSPLEVEMKRDFANAFRQVPPPIPHPIFLYDMEQLADTNEMRSAQFRHDLQTYLGLEQPMPPIVQANKGKRKPSPSTREYIDICDSKFTRLRAELLLVSRRASRWLRECFLDGTDVHVSSRYYLEEILEKWMQDPCDARRQDREVVEEET